MQRPIGHALIHERRYVGNHDDEIEQHTCNHWFSHEINDPTRTVARKNEIKQPIRCSKEHKWWNKIRIHHVLKHVY